MPRLTNSLPKYRKHKASGQAIVTLDGRDFYLGPHGTKASLRTPDLLGKYLTLVSGLGSDERVGELQLGAGTRHLGGVEMLKQIGDRAVPAGIR